MSLAISTSGVSGPTHSTPLCITSLTFMVDLLCCVQLSPVPTRTVEVYIRLGRATAASHRDCAPNGNSPNCAEFQVPSALRQIVFGVEGPHIRVLERAHLHE